MEEVAAKATAKHEILESLRPRAALSLAELEVKRVSAWCKDTAKDEG